MTTQEQVALCRRGHPRTPENSYSRTRTLRSGKQVEYFECRTCRSALHRDPFRERNLVQRMISDPQVDTVQLEDVDKLKACPKCAYEFPLYLDRTGDREDPVRCTICGWRPRFITVPLEKAR